MLSTIMTIDEASVVMQMINQADALTCHYDTDTLYYPDALGPTIDSAYGSIALGQKQELINYAATKRFYVETTNITVNSHPITMTREARVGINSALASVNENPALTINWKYADGTFEVLDQAGVQAIAQAAGAHVQSAFDAESQAGTDINNGAITDHAGVDAAFAGVTP